MGQPIAEAATPEPVLVSHVVQTVLVAATALQWVLLDNVQISAVVTAVGALGSLAVALVARGRVRAIRAGEDGAAAIVDEVLDVVLDQLPAVVRDIVTAELAAARDPDRLDARTAVTLAGSRAPGQHRRGT